jgi:hypothetical protein
MLCAAMLALATAAASAQQKDPYGNIYANQKRAAYKLSMGRFFLPVSKLFRLRATAGAAYVEIASQSAAEQQSTRFNFLESELGSIF